jgi:hypothetical protein
VLVRYGIKLDEKDDHGLASCFTRSCDLHYPRGAHFTSAEEIAAFMARGHAGLTTMHRITNMDVTLGEDGRTARAVSYVDALLVPDGLAAPVRQVVGRYDDVLGIDEDTWKITSRHVTIVWSNYNLHLTDAD